MQDARDSSPISDGSYASSRLWSSFPESFANLFNMQDARNSSFTDDDSDAPSRTSSLQQSFSNTFSAKVAGRGDKDEIVGHSPDENIESDEEEDESFLLFMRLVEGKRDEPAMSRELESPWQRQSSLSQESSNMSGRSRQLSDHQARPQQNGKANNLYTQSLPVDEDESFLRFLQLLGDEGDDPSMSRESEGPLRRHRSLEQESRYISDKPQHRSKSQGARSGSSGLGSSVTNGEKHGNGGDGEGETQRKQSRPRVQQQRSIASRVLGLLDPRSGDHSWLG